MRVESVAFDPRRLVRDVVGFWTAEAQRKGLFLALTGEAALPMSASGDPMRLRQILNNLISNAVKFTGSGGVTLEVETHDGPNGTTELSLTVADTGRGLTEEQLERLFTPFDQTDDTIARTHGGTGLGLAISRELARLMGGDLTVENGARGGARFTARVRLQSAAETAPAPQKTQAATAAGHRPPRILVVDDHPIGRKAMSVLLQPLGAVVAEADSGEAALDALSVERFDLVLMDVTMAGMGGHEAARRLRSQPGPNRGVAMLAASGLTGREDVAACLAAGMNGCVAKPLEPAALYAAIERVLTGAPEPEQATEAA